MIAVAAEPLPEDTASRMVQFTELVATAIANIDARSALTASRARTVAAADENDGEWRAISTGASSLQGRAALSFPDGRESDFR